MSGINITNRIGTDLPIILPGQTVRPQPASGESFGDILSGLLDEVNGLQQQAGDLKTQLINGEAPDLHQIMIAGEKAGVALELLIQIRNKLVEAYQDLMRMPV